MENNKLERESGAFVRIDRAIKKIPYDEIATWISKSLEIEEPPGVVQDDAEEAIECLEEMVYLANEDAIHRLVYLGCKITRVLSRLVDATEVNETRLRSKVGEKKRVNVDQECEDLKGGDFRFPSFEDDIKTLSGASRVDLESMIDMLKKGFPRDRFLVDFDSLISLLSDPREDGSKVQDSARTASSSVGENEESVDPINRSLVETICTSLVNRKISPAAAIAVRKVIGESSAWPIEVSAIVDNRSKILIEQVNNLGLGALLSINMGRKSGSWRVRNFEVGSPGDFILNIVVKLEKVRKGLYSESHRSEASGAVFVLDNWEKDKSVDYSDDDLKSIMAKIGFQFDEHDYSHDDLKSMMTKMGLRFSEHKREFSRDSALSTIWRYRAMLLPPLSKEKVVLEEWKNAAMAYLEYVCGGDFETMKWPAFIMNRTYYETKGRRGETCKNALAEALRRDLVNFAKS